MPRSRPRPRKSPEKTQSTQQASVFETVIASVYRDFGARVSESYSRRYVVAEETLALTEILRTASELDEPVQEENG